MPNLTLSNYDAATVAYGYSSQELLRWQDQDVDEELLVPLNLTERQPDRLKAVGGTALTGAVEAAADK